MASFIIFGYNSLATFLLLLLSLCQIRAMAQAINESAYNMKKDVSHGTNKELVRCMNNVTHDINKKQVAQNMSKDVVHEVSKEVADGINKKQVAQGVSKEKAVVIDKKQVAEEMRKEVVHEVSKEVADSINKKQVAQDVSKEKAVVINKKQVAEEMSKEVVHEVSKEVADCINKKQVALGMSNEMFHEISKEMVPSLKTRVGDEKNEDPSANVKHLCHDSSAPGHVSDCAKYSYLCDNVVYYDLMTWQCPSTCERCSELTIPTPRTGILPNGTCIDLKGPNGRSDCRRHIHLCRDPRYISLMANECPKTCHYCSEK